MFFPSSPDPRALSAAQGSLRSSVGEDYLCLCWGSPKIHHSPVSCPHATASTWHNPRCPPQIATCAWEIPADVPGRCVPVSTACRQLRDEGASKPGEISATASTHPLCFYLLCQCGFSPVPSFGASAFKAEISAGWEGRGSRRPGEGERWVRWFWGSSGGLGLLQRCGFISSPFASPFAALVKEPG